MCMRFSMHMCRGAEEVGEGAGQGRRRRQKLYRSLLGGVTYSVAKHSLTSVSLSGSIACLARTITPLAVPPPPPRGHLLPPSQFSLVGLGAPTSWGMSGRGQGVVDYALVPAHLLPLAALSVVDRAVSDHAALLLCITAPQPARQPGMHGHKAAQRRRRRARQHVAQRPPRRAPGAHRPPPPAITSGLPMGRRASATTTSVLELLPPAWLPTPGWQRSKRRHHQHRPLSSWKRSAFNAVSC
jgi:hypothetical protein